MFPAATLPVTDFAGRGFVVRRLIPARAEAVWEMWTKPECLRAWLGEDFEGREIEIVKFDLRPGGEFHYYAGVAPGGGRGRFLYREVVAPSRLVFVSFATEPEPGNPCPFPLKYLNILTLEPHASSTVLTFRMLPLNATAAQIRTHSESYEYLESLFGRRFARIADFLAKA